MCMTLFDHYCAKLHTGLAIDGPTALALRDEITRAIDQTPGALAFHPFRRGILSAARATLKAPLELADLASRGALRRLVSRNNDVRDREPGRRDRGGDRSRARREVELSGTHGDGGRDAIVVGGQSVPRWCDRGARSPVARTHGHSVIAERAALANAKRVVVKCGSRLIAEAPASRPATIADQVVVLKQRGVEVVIVSSGAIALGIGRLKLAARPTELPGCKRRRRSGNRG